MEGTTSSLNMVTARPARPHSGTGEFKAPMSEGGREGGRVGGREGGRVQEREVGAKEMAEVAVPSLGCGCIIGAAEEGDGEGGGSSSDNHWIIIMRRSCLHD